MDDFGMDILFNTLGKLHIDELKTTGYSCQRLRGKEDERRRLLWHR